MGRVRVTEKPGEWPYVLVNDFKNPPYFAYEQVNDDGTKRFVPVLRGGPTEDEVPPTPRLNLNLTGQRKAKITRFLKSVLKEPLKFGKYMSKEWLLELVKVLNLFDEQTVNATTSIVVKWLKNMVFRKLINEIEEKCGWVGAKDSEEGTPIPSSSSQMVASKDVSASGKN